MENENISDVDKSVPFLKFEEETAENRGKSAINCAVEDKKEHVSSSNNNSNELSGVISNNLNCITGSDNLYVNSMYEALEENRKLKALVETLQQENTLVDLESSKEFHIIQIETLEKAVDQQKIENERLQRHIRQQAELSQKEIIQLKEDYNLKYDKLLKQCEQAAREKESMVMKYAVSENIAIQLQQQIKALENKLKDQQKEKDALDNKVKIISAEKLKQSQLINGKNNEITGLERDVQKKLDELHAQSSNLKFFQNKLKIEMESHKETQIKLEKCTQKLKEAREETEQIRKDGQVMLHKYETEGRKVLELKDAEELTTLQTELGTLQNKNSLLLEDNDKLQRRIRVLELEAADHEENLSLLQQSRERFQNLLNDFQCLQKEQESSQEQYLRVQKQLGEVLLEKEELEQINVDLQQEAEKCREREADLLAFTQLLTEKNVAIQSELTGMETRLHLKEMELSSAKELIKTLTDNNSSLKIELEREQKQREEEKMLLNKHLEERTATAEQLSKQLEDQIGETQLLKKKHLASIKELGRELQQCRRRGETLETNSLSQGSRTSSNSSLNIEPFEPKIVIPGSEPDRQLLIEKIVKVQRSNARKQEKIEFLDGHVNQLVLELKRKSKIIQSLVMKQQPSALVSESMDANKAALIKHKGIMASVYSSTAADDALTLELSLEMNRKLQAVLEDILLKNITLKENMETLGNEIARLSSRPPVDTGT